MTEIENDNDGTDRNVRMLVERMSVTKIKDDFSAFNVCQEWPFFSFPVVSTKKWS